ncbi:hypothetical protein E2I00_012005, partial [Balaenoptera physalus]
MQSPRPLPLLSLLLLLLGAGVPGAWGQAGSLDLQIDEEQPAGTLIGDISAGLPAGTAAPPMYFISAQEGSGVGTDLAIDEHSGVVRTARVLDRERRDRYRFTAVTPDGATVEVTVRVADINDHAPAFPQARAVLQIPEHTALGTRYPLEPARDGDADRLGTQGYALSGDGAGEIFRLETRPGPDGAPVPELVVTGELDRENRSHYMLQLEAYDGGSPPRRAQALLDVTLLDINDHAPAFNQSRYHAVVSESLAPGSPVLQVYASDADAGANGAVTYEINRRQSEDANDNQPSMTVIFLSADGSPRVSEAAPPGQLVARISVSDPDDGDFAHVNVSLEGGEGHFALSTQDSVIYLVCVARQLDREERDAYNLRVTATDSGSPPLRAEAAFVLHVTDVNDNAPAFDRQLYRPEPLPEVALPGSFVVRVMARDPDQGTNGQVTYSLAPGAHTRWFSIDPTSGIITTAASLDYELEPQPQLIVVATDGGLPPLTSSATVSVALQDVNDNEPQFQRTFYNASLPEGIQPGTCFLQVFVSDENDNPPQFYPREYAASLSAHSTPGTAVLRVRAHDPDQGPHGRLSYHILAGNSPPLFALDQHSGLLTVAWPLARRANSVVQLEIGAQDGGGLQAEPSARVNISIVPGTPIPPVFEQLQYVFSVPEDVPPGTSVGVVQAHNPSGRLGPVTLTLSGGDPRGLFSLDGATGLLQTLRALDRELLGPVLELEVRAGSGVPPAFAVARVRVLLDDVNDNSPAFPAPEDTVLLPPSTAPGTPIYTLRALDPDSGVNSRVTFTLLAGGGGAFTVDPTTGHILLMGPLGPPGGPAHELELEARDGGSPPRTSHFRLRVVVQDLGTRGLAPHFDSPTYPDGPSSPFGLEPQSGWLWVRAALDREAQELYTLKVMAVSGSKAELGQQTATATVRVSILNQNDHSPRLSEEPTFLAVAENQPPGTSVGRVFATDRDSGPNGRLTYSLRQLSEDSKAFRIHPQTGSASLATPYMISICPALPGEVTTLQTLDRERQSSYQLLVQVQDGGSPPRTTDRPANASRRRAARVSARVFVTDENDNAPVFASPSRALSVVRSLDREQRAEFVLTVVASDHGSPPRSATQLLTVSVADVNDEAPAFQQQEYSVLLRENSPPGTSLLTLRATDPDLGANGQVTYGGISGESFSLDPDTGVLTTLRALDREEQQEINLTVYARDGGSPPLLTHVTVRVAVEDENDHAPAFGSAHLSLEVPEGQDPQTLTTLRASDPDVGANGQLQYRILDGDPSEAFVLDLASGEFGTMRPLDREVEPAFQLQIEARDGGQPALSATLLVTVTVLDANDHAPAFPVPAYSVEVPEDAPAGTLLLQLQAHDPDAGPNGHVTYYLGAGAAGAFLLEPSSGELRTATALDREQCPSYAFTVNAVDGAAAGPLSTTVPITIMVRDVNDHAPTFPTSPLRLRLPRPGPSLSTPTLALATLRAEDRDAGANASILYRLAGTPPPGTTVDSYTGEIRVARSPVTLGPQDRVLFIVATDLGRPARSATGVVIVGLQGESERGPRFPRASSEAMLRENAPPGTPIVSPKAIHTGGSSGPITYSILSGNEKGTFSIQPSTGAVTVRSAEGLDFEASPRLRLVLQAESGGAFAFSVLTLTLQDANDNAPRFLRPHYVAFLPESRPLEGPLLQVEADDLDQGPSGQISYSLAASQPARGLFHVDSATGTITTTAILDREIWAETRLVLMATDRGSPALVGSATLTVMVIDTNDNRPTIPQPWELRVSEDALLGSEIAQVTGNDVDSGPVLWYVLSPSGPQDPFSVGRYGGRLSLTGPLDFEQRDRYHLQLLAHDGPHEGRANLTVLVEDVNDNAPAFSQTLYQVMLLEHTPPGSAILSVSATDRDSGANGHVSYHLASPAEGFSVDPNNGTLFTTVGTMALGHEGPGVVDVVLEARDHGTPARAARTTVHVQLQDQNDHAPSFTLPHYRVAVTEDLPPGSTLLTLEATDADGSRTHATVDYSIVSGNRGRVFQLEPRLAEAGEGDGLGPRALGCLVLLEPLDFESLTQYNLTVAAADRGQPPRSSAVPVTVTVLDVNDNPPVFTRASYRVAVPEDTPVGAELLHVEASDADPGPHGLVRFTLSSGDPFGLFQLDESSGDLRLAHPLDCETQARHQLVVRAADPAGAHFALAPVTIEVQDVNDHRPAFPLSLLSTSLAENQPPGTLVTTLHAIDGDAGAFGRLRYNLLEAGPGPEGREAFALNSSTGELRARVAFDYEHTGSFQLLVGATDAGNLSASVTVSVLVTGEDEYDPVFLAPAFHFQVPEGARRGHSLGHVQATDEDGGADGLVLYSLATSSPYFGINQTTGALYLRVDSRAPGSGTGTSGGGGRTRREAPRELRLEVVARGPLPGSRRLVRARSRKAEAAPGPMSQAAPLASGSLQKLGREPPSPPPSEHLYHQTLPSYGGPGAGGPYPRGGSLDPSHSSGRGSAEAAEDDEIRMINEFPRVASVASSLAARGPDSGIQQDADGLSDTSCEPPAPDTWYKGRKAGLLLPGAGATLYREEGPPAAATAFLGGCGLSPAPTGDYGFPADGKPCVAGALTAIVAGEEELRGSYNWDYLLSWCPQFQPLA